MTKIPEGWAESAIPQIAEVLDTKRIPINSDERAARIDGKSQQSLVAYYGATGQVGWIDTHLFDEDLVLLGEDGVPFLDPGKPKAYRVSGKSWVNNHAHVLRARQDALDWRLLEAQLNTLNYTGHVTGSTRLKLTQGAMNKLPILVPPLAEQKRIADKLDTVLTRVDAVNTRLARVAPLLKRFRQSVLAAATSGRLTEDWRAKNPGGNATTEIAAQVAKRSTQEKKEIAIPNLEHWTLQIPSEWTVASVHQFAECLDRLRVPIKKDQRNAAKGLYPYYGANGEVGRIDEFIFDDELVLVTEDETFYGREKPIAYRSSGKCWVNNHAHVLRCKSVPANEYLCFALMYYHVIPWLSGTTGRAKLTQQALLSLPIGAPPETEQTEIVRRVETLFAFADRLEARLAQAQTAATRLTPALLAKAFRGELVPQDPNDEPAAELLRRLAQAPAAASPRKGRKPKSTII